MERFHAHLQASVFMAGYTCEAHNNPADFFLDVINADTEAIGTNFGFECKNALLIFMSLKLYSTV